MLLRFSPRSAICTPPKAIQGCAQRRPATAAVELAILVPILAALFIGMVELSRGWQAKNILSDAARKGCRTGILANKANSDITNDVNNILKDNNINYSAATITILLNGTNTDVANAKRGDTISVQVAIPVAQVYWGGTFFLTAAQIESETVVMMRQE